jgi:hypothetical protein
MNSSSDKKAENVVIDVIVKTQKGKFEAPLAETDTVQAVITATAKALGFDPSDRFELVLESDRKKELAPGIELGSLLKRHDDKKSKLDFALTATGSGV